MKPYYLSGHIIYLPHLPLDELAQVLMVWSVYLDEIEPRLMDREPRRN